MPIHEEDIQYMMPVMEIFIRGYCFYRLVKPFMISGAVPDDICVGKEVSAAKQKKGVFFVGAAYVLIMLLLYLMPKPVDVLAAYGIGSLVMFFLICLADRRNYRQKAFLVIISFSLNWVFAAIAEILYDHLYAFAEHTDHMRQHPELFPALYAAVCVFYLVLEFAFMLTAVCQIVKVYKNKNADMKSRELILLSFPVFMGVIAYRIIQNYRMFYIVESGESRAAYDILILLFYLVSVITVVAVIVLYQDVRTRQEEQHQAELLAVQMDSIRRHMERVEALSRKIRGIRHDMSNHILILERLYEGNKTEEAKAYGEDVKAELAQMSAGAKSGNPVTDVILQEFQKEAEKRKISFCSEFYYPVDSGIDVFDISIILNNILQNAIENTEKEQKKQISVLSYRRNNAYMIEVCNSFTGSLQWDTENGLPLTSKKKTDGHGYGLVNVRRVAAKYAGDIDITLKEGEFCLCIMLMTE